MNSELTDENIKSRPSTAKSMQHSIPGSISSLKSLFSRNAIHPFDSGVVYGIEEEMNDSSKISSKKSVVSISPAVVNDNNTMVGHGWLAKVISEIRHAWAQKMKENLRANPELFIKKTLKDLFLYIIFLALLIIISLGMLNTSSFFFANNLNTNVLSYQFNGGTGSFATIKSMGDFWQYVQGPLMQSLYWNTWYNQRKNLSALEKTLIYYDDKLVGLPRMRLLRVKQNSCVIPKIFQSIIPYCYGEYSEENLDKTSFGPANASAWIYAESNTSYEYSGNIGTYGGGGFMQLLTLNNNASLAIINYLMQNQWLTRNSRVVFIDYTIYNSNVDLFGLVKLAIEFPPTGGAISTVDVRAVKLLRYVSSYDYFVLCCEILYLIFIIYYIIVEVIEIIKHRSLYFVELWNVVDVFVVIISLACILLSVFKVVLTNSKLESLLLNQNGYPDFDFVRYWQKIYNEAICVNVFLSWIKIFKYLTFNKTMTQLTDTLIRGLANLASFGMMFCIVFFAYSQFAYFLLNTQIVDYKEFGDAIFALFRIILADFDLYAIIRANSILGPLFFISFVFFVFFVLLSMFVAIINESYIDVKERIDELKQDFHVAQFLKQKIFSVLKMDKITKIQEVLENGDFMNLEELSFEEWRKELLKYGYAEVEIQALFMRYDKDCNRVLDYDERNQMLEDVKNKKFTLMEQETSEDTIGNKSRDNTDLLTPNLMDELVKRTTDVEKGLSEIVTKLDRLFLYLADNEHTKLDHQKSVRLSLSFITGLASSFK